ncbi:MAG: 16S rRNA (uracil(1498)-N(3))-methyltransferase [Alphaproteobacteria bacterium]|nr:16S rRNA (uracil(1498)-N(3))-methyltransferase [Alphaproteobacteria bacterium]
MTESHKLPRLFTEGPLSEGAAAVLDVAQTHYLKNVLRKQQGDRLRVFNGKDGEFTALIEKLGKKEAIIRLGEMFLPQPSAAPPVHLIFAPIKKARLDILIEKAVELGATQLHPVLTERTENRKINPERLEAQIIEALEQCERLVKPQLHPLQKLEKLIPAWQGPPILSCLEREDAPLLTTELKSGYTQGLALLIGPEGGFTPKEISYIAASRICRPISLGSFILRAETAALYALSLVSSLISGQDFATERKSSGSD